ncbi:biopolymer transport protein ExbD [Dyadobacter jejuensis]|uniref:Biopolymer transport protein ExbD n=1 Tax=Dyadobacter jejuensis TaxID=1082580 RepID=A0A316AQF8_9BACT|nr:biopolymer transporter ExbD [Dyadobacter jejuensis]PWJ59963.1 biopolymer transport protein ExbD [Dyadobacter jejuensis]
MAAIEESGGGGKDDGKVRGKKVSTRVDMTPMVDLGFLLITFFMLATTMSKPTSMTLAVPDKNDDKEQAQSEPLRASKVLTLFMGGDDEVYYLDGIAADDDAAAEKLGTTKYGYDLRTVIFTSQKRINSQNPKDEKGNDAFVVVIKPTPASTYKNMVDVLDEMAITKSKRYALVDNLTDSEKKVLGDKISTPEK